MTKKVTTMKLEVDDLQCEKCYKKVKKVLCKFPQIRDQEFDEKKNIVTIKVVCCSPEKIMDQLCCKGRGAIKRIEIVPPPPPPPEPRPPCQVSIGVCCVLCYEGRLGGPCSCGCGGRRPYYVSRCDQYFSEDNATGCTIL